MPPRWSRWGLMVLVGLFGGPAILVIAATTLSSGASLIYRYGWATDAETALDLAISSGSVAVLVVLAIVTAMYTVATQRIAEATREQSQKTREIADAALKQAEASRVLAEEARQQRFASLRPVLVPGFEAAEPGIPLFRVAETIRFQDVDKIIGGVVKIIGIWNIGVGPALNVSSELRPRISEGTGLEDFPIPTLKHLTPLGPGDRTEVALLPQILPDFQGGILILKYEDVFKNSFQTRAEIKMAKMHTGDVRLFWGPLEIEEMQTRSSRHDP